MSKNDGLFGYKVPVRPKCNKHDWVVNIDTLRRQCRKCGVVE